MKEPGKKILVLLLMLFLSPVIAGCYGILHDQLTYSLCHEYYTKFKFIQFGLLEEGQVPHFRYPRIHVAIVGFFATWWMGLPIGFILGLTGLIHRNAKRMLRVTLQAMLLTLFVAFITGLIGLLYGHWYLADHGVDWYFPKDLIDRKAFIRVGSMHNFSYLGGLTGLIAAIYYSLRQRNRPGTS